MMNRLRDWGHRFETFDWLSLGLITLLFALALSYWSKFPVHMRTFYHLGVTSGYSRAGGIALHSFLVWFLTSTYVLPWYLMMGLMLAAVPGWSLTTACLVGAASVSTLYLIPWPPGGYPKGPTMYQCVPFLLLLVGWIALTLMRRYSGSGAVVPASATAEATEET